MVTPKVALPGELDTLVQTEANAFRFTEAMNVSLLVIPVDRKRPKVLWFSLGGEDGDYPATDAGKETYVFSSMLELYFDQPVDIPARGGQKMVTFVPERFESMKPFFPRFGTCWNETEPQEPQLAPCRLYVNDTTVVNVDSVGTKVTVNPRALMPGATYTVHVGDGVFELKEDGTLKSEYFRLRVMVPHDLSQVTCSEDGDTHAHRTVSFKLSFPSPIFPLGGSLSVGPYTYNASDLDFVLTANDAGHPDSSSQYVAIVDPRVDGKDTLPQDSDFVVATAGDAFENLLGGDHPAAPHRGGPARRLYRVGARQCGPSLHRDHSQVLRESSGRRRRAGHHAQGPRRLLLGPRRGADADLQRVLIRAGALGGTHGREAGARAASA
jgi:hypothetical protein